MGDHGSEIMLRSKFNWKVHILHVQAGNHGHICPPLRDKLCIHHLLVFGLVGIGHRSSPASETKKNTRFRNQNVRFRNRNAKGSKPRHPLRPLCCILNFTRDLNPTTPSDHYVITMVQFHKRSKPRHPLWPLCCILNFTRDQILAIAEQKHFEKKATQSKHEI